MGSSGSGQSFAPSLSATWPAGRNLALWSCVTYMRETTHAVVPLVLASPKPGYAGWPSPVVGGDRRTHFIPITLGLRGYARNNGGKPQGLFIEAGPSCTVARYWSVGGVHRFAVLGGLQAGTGVRFPTSDNSHGEIGMSYYLADAFSAHPDAVGRLGRPDRVDLSLFALYVALGFGN